MVAYAENISVSFTIGVGAAGITSSDLHFIIRDLSDDVIYAHVK
jgi:hypothetical protein